MFLYVLEHDYVLQREKNSNSNSGVGREETFRGSVWEWRLFLKLWHMWCEADLCAGFQMMQLGEKQS